MYHLKQRDNWLCCQFEVNGFTFLRVMMYCKLLLLCYEPCNQRCSLELAPNWNAAPYLAKPATRISAGQESEPAVEGLPRRSRASHAALLIAARGKRSDAWPVSVAMFSITLATGAAQKLPLASYLVKNPASTGKAHPVIWRASSDASQSTTELMSSGFKRLLSCKRFISFMR